VNFTITQRVLTDEEGGKNKTIFTAYNADKNYRLINWFVI
jgi:hypothetical protein